MTDDRMASNHTDAGARAVIGRLATDTLPRLIDRLARSELGELEVRDDGWRIRLRRANGVDTPAAETRAEPRERGRHTATPGSGGQSERERSAAGRSAGTARHFDQDRAYVTSVAVGYFIAREGLSVGTKVNQGDVVGHVDVLGVPQEVVASVGGVIGAFEVEPGEAIEFGQRIARVDPVGVRDQVQPSEELETATSEQLLVEA